MVTYGGLDLFGSGPHRVRVSRAGRLYVPPLTRDNLNTFTLDYAAAELEVEQVGRLVSATEVGLWALSEAVRAEAEAPGGKALVLAAGQSLSDMWMLRYEATGPVDRGRVYSVPYVIEYRNIGY